MLTVQNPPMYGRTSEHKAESLRGAPWLDHERDQLEIPQSGRRFLDLADERMESVPRHESETMLHRGRPTWPDLTPWHVGRGRAGESPAGRILDEVEASGFDVLAWYVSYRSHERQ